MPKRAARHATRSRLQPSSVSAPVDRARPGIERSGEERVGPVLPESTRDASPVHDNYAFNLASSTAARAYVNDT